MTNDDNTPTSDPREMEASLDSILTLDYTAGMSLPALAAMHGIRIGQVRDALRRTNTTIKRGRPSKVTADCRELILHLESEGLRADIIARRVSIPKANVLRVCRENGRYQRISKLAKPITSKTPPDAAA